MQDDPQSEPNLSKSIPRSLLMLSLPQTKGDPSLRWLIIDGRKLALSHGCGEIYSYDAITLAVQDLWNKKTHRKLMVCVPEWMKTHEELDYHYLTELQDHLFIFYMPSEDKGPSLMDALARVMGALIVTQLGRDTWSEPRKRILQFNFVDDSLMLPEDPWGKNGPDLSSLLCSENPKEISVQTVVQDLMLKWERFSEILSEPPASFPEKRGNIEKLLIIDGSNVAMSHGLDTFFSCGGIYLAVLRLLKEGYCNITVFVPHWRYISRNTVYGYKYLDLLYKKGFVTLTPSLCYEDGMMLKVAKEKNGLIVTNDLFKDLRKTWKDVINSRISYGFDRNHFIMFPNGAQVVGESTVQPPGVVEGSAYVPNSGQTLHPDPPRPEDEDTT